MRALEGRRPGAACVDVLVDLNRYVQQTPSLRHPDGAGRVPARGDARARPRLVPRLRLAARQHAAAASGSPRASCPATRSSSSADEKPLRRPGRRRATTRPISTPGPRSSSPARAGSASTPPAACWPARGTSRWPAPPDPETAAAITGQLRLDQDEGGRQGRGDLRLLDVRPADATSRRASPLPYTRRGVERRSSPSGARSTRRSSPDDVRLTMGGEPTFVADRRPRGARVEHRRAGPDQAAATPTDLMRRLYARFAPHGLLHEGQGKWYPGEPLPRWALSCYFRKDGLPIWHDPTLFATGRAGLGRPPPTPRAFVAALAAELGVDAGAARWPPTRTPGTTCGASAGSRSTSTRTSRKLEDPVERARLARVFEQGLGERRRLRAAPAARDRRRPAGAGRAAGGSCGPSGMLPHPRRLADGLSPAARLAALGGARRQGRPLSARSVRAARPAAGAARAGRGLACGRPGRASRSTPTPRRRSRSSRSRGVVRSALCVEPREGVLHVFMPPVDTVEEYLDSRARAVEATAEQLQQARAHRGLPRRPPTRASGASRSRRTPASSRSTSSRRATGRSSSENTTVLYEEARNTELRAEKFMLDGRHTGTGGGNHIVLGGATPGDSPILRRPDLLRSLVGYWLNHPSLSYLFSGHVRRADEPGAARRRGARRQHLRARARVPAARGQRARRSGPRPRGWSTASFATCSSTSRATPTAPSSASTSSTAPTAPRAAWASSSCARSRCRRTRE